MRASLATLASLSLWVALACNVWVVAVDLATGHYRSGALQAIAVAVLTAWLYFVRKIDQWLDTAVGEVTARRRIAELSLHVVEEQVRTGNVSLTIVGERGSMH